MEIDEKATLRVLEEGAALQSATMEAYPPWGFDGYDDAVISYHVRECRENGWMIDISAQRGTITSLTGRGTEELQRLRNEQGSA